MGSYSGAAGGTQVAQDWSVHRWFVERHLAPFQAEILPAEFPG